MLPPQARAKAFNHFGRQAIGACVFPSGGVGDHPQVRIFFTGLGEELFDRLLRRCPFCAASLGLS